MTTDTKYTSGDFRSWNENKEVIKHNLVNISQELDVVEAFIYSSEGIIANTAIVEKRNLGVCLKALDHEILASEKGELIKHVRLNTEKYLFHGVILAMGFILGLLYNEDTPYSVVRKQSLYFVNRFLHPQVPDEQAISLQEEITGSEKYIDIPVRIEAVETIQVQKASTSLQPGVDEMINDNNSDHELGDELNSREETEGVISEPDNENSLRINPEVAQAIFSTAEQEPSPVFTNPHLGTQPSWLMQEAEIRDYDADDNQESGFISAERSQVSSINSGINKDWEISSIDKLTFLSYACLLIPRVKTDHLIKDLDKKLGEVVRDIFLAYGWRLESLRIDRDTFQWVANIPCTMSPARHIQIIREETSKFILSNFPNLCKAGIIKDFWAPGFLLENNNQLIQNHKVEEFIVGNRKQYYPEEKIQKRSESRLFNYQ